MIINDHFDVIFFISFLHTQILIICKILRKRNCRLTRVIFYAIDDKLDAILHNDTYKHRISINRRNFAIIS